MQKGKAKQQSKKASKPRIDINFVILLLSLLPIFVSGFLQGGYFLWETYLTLLCAMPAILLFLWARFREGEVVKSGVDLGLGIFLLVCLLSLFFTVYFHATFTELLKVLIQLSLFYIVLNCTANEFHKNFVLWSFLLLSVFLSLAGILAYFAYRFNLSSAFFKFLINYGLVQADRVSSTLQYANTFAAFLILPFFIAVSSFLGGKKAFKKVIYILLALFFLATFVLTQSRGGFVAFAFSLFLLVFLLKGKERKLSLVSLTASLIAILLLALIRRDLFLPVIKSFVDRLKVMLSFFAGKWEESLGMRVYMLKDSLRILKDYPVFGTGNGTYQYIYAKYRTIYFFSKFPHSIFFQILDELGIVGAASFVLMIFSLFRKGFRVIRENYSPVLVGIYSGLAGLFLHALVDFDWSLPFMPLTFFLLFALFISQGKKELVSFDGSFSLRELLRNSRGKGKPAKPVKSPQFTQSRIRKLILVAMLIVTVVLIFQFSAAMTNYVSRRNEGLVTNDKTLSAFQSAVALNPLVAEFHYEVANFCTAKVIPSIQDPSKYFQLAESEYLAAIRRCPMYYIYHFELGKLYLATGNQKSVDEFTKTVKLNPLDPGAHASLGFAYLNMKKDSTLAKIQFEEALRLDSHYEQGFIGLGRVYEELNEPEEALKYYSEAIKINAKNDNTYYRIGLIYEGRGDLTKAAENLFKAYKLNPNNLEARTAFEKYGPIITILKPLVGEQLKKGAEHEIVWDNSNENNLEYFEIALLSQDGKETKLSPNVPASTFSYNIRIPEEATPGKYWLRVYAYSPKFLKDTGETRLSYGEAEVEVVEGE